ncbi:MAG: DUF835 domain-containing protein [Nanoarchaeota archaeon]|nr:DUF835 domain-containing protein [Nanoarchaeota archaeon]
MKIEKKLLISFTVIIAFLLISAIITTIYTLRIDNQLDKITQEINPLERNVQNMMSILWKGNYIVQKYSIESDPEILEELKYEFSYINSVFEEEADKITSSEYHTISGDVSIAVNKHDTFYKLAKKLIQKRDLDLAKGVVYDESSIIVQYSIAKQLERDVVDAVDSLQESLNGFSEIKEKANRESNLVVRNAIVVIFLTTILSIILSLIVWSSLTKAITKPVKALSEAATKITRGDFDINLDVKDQDDEISDLAFTFNQMVSSLRKIIEESPRLKRFINLKGKKERLTKKYIVESGTSYLLKDSSSSEAYEILIDKMNEEYTPLLITRQNPSIVEQKYGLQKKNIIWLSDEKEKGLSTSSDLNQIKKVASEFMEKNKDSIILMDRSDYIINKYGFDNFLRFITNINDKVMTREAIFLLPVDPVIFTNKQLSLLEKELHRPPEHAVKSSITDELMDILEFIDNQNSINKQVTYKNIGSRFSITAPTTQKKIEDLQSLGMVTISKIGRNKVIKVTRQGERVLANK